MFTSSVKSPSERLDQYNKKCRQAEVEIYINREGDLEMFFPKKGYLPCTEDAIFSQKWFPMPMAYPLPDKLLHQLGPGAAPVIPAGQYPIKKVSQGYIITF